MERTKLGPPVQFQDDAGAWHVGRMLMDKSGMPIRDAGWSIVVLHDTRDIVLVPQRHIRPNVPNPPLPAESQSWHDMMDEVARLPEQCD